MAAQNITETGAQIKGKLLSSGNSSNVSLSFEYGKEQGNYTDIKEAQFDPFESMFRAYLTELDENTTYYFRTKACNEKGCSYGEELSFKTSMTTNMPTLKTMSFTEKQDKSIVSFEIESTGHKDISVNKATLNIFDNTNIVLTSSKQGTFEKDIPYVFELDTSSLSKGKTYSYSITLENSSKTYESQKTSFTTKPGDVSNITATKIDLNKIKLSFTKGLGSTGTIILNKDKNVVYKGNEETFEYNLSKEDTYLYLISFVNLNETELQGFNETRVEVGSYFEEVKEEKGIFNKSSADHPLRLGNHTQAAGTQNWTTDLVGVNTNDELRFSVYYHNSSDRIAKNTKVSVELSSTSPSDNFELISKLTADEFEDYTTKATIKLNSIESIEFQNTAKWYRKYDGSKYEIVDINVDLTEKGLVFTLGDIEPGYRPNDGYIIFNAVINDVFPKEGDQVFEILQNNELEIDRKEELFKAILNEVNEIKSRELIIEDDFIIQIDYGEESQNYTDNLTFSFNEFNKESLNELQIKSGLYYKIKLCNEAGECLFGKEHLLQ